MFLSIGRRGDGLEIVERALEYIEKMNIHIVEIEAQEHLKEFYSSFRFVQTSQPFDDCGISYIVMRKEFSFNFSQILRFTHFPVFCG